MAIEVHLPDLGQGAEEVTLTDWFVEEGDQVEEGDELAEISTEDETFSVLAPAMGVLHEHCYKENEVVLLGDVIAILEEDITDDYSDLDDFLEKTDE